MKKFLFTAILLFVALCVTAQTDDDYSWYLNKAKEQLGKGECEKAERNYIHYINLAHDSLPQLYRQIQECLGEQEQAREKVDTEIVFVPVQVPVTESKSETKEESQKEHKFNDLMKDSDNPYCNKNKNRYIAWAIAGAGYPWNVTMGVELRGGGILGIGGYADIGMDFLPISCDISYVDRYDNNVHSYETEFFQVSFKYIGGVRLFYKGLFFSLGYGSVTRIQPIELKYDNDYFADDIKDDILKMIKGHGLHISVGYNLVTPSANGFFLGISGGFAYDIVNKAFAPSFNLKLGMSFEWKKY